jgi:low temperature requirement protein LtrA
MKQLENGCSLEAADLDGDGIVTEEELNKHERYLRIENEDKKEDAQRGMAWFALFGMLLYPFAVVLADLLGLDQLLVYLEIWLLLISFLWLLWLQLTTVRKHTLKENNHVTSTDWPGDGTPR